MEGARLPIQIVDGKIPNPEAKRVLLLDWQNDVVLWKQPDDPREAMSDGTHWLVVINPYVYGTPEFISKLASERIKQAELYHPLRDPSYNWREQAKRKRLGG